MEVHVHLWPGAPQLVNLILCYLFVYLLSSSIHFFMIRIFMYLFILTTISVFGIKIITPITHYVCAPACVYGCINVHLLLYIHVRLNNQPYTYTQMIFLSYRKGQPFIEWHSIVTLPNNRRRGICWVKFQVRKGDVPRSKISFPTRSFFVAREQRDWAGGLREGCVCHFPLLLFLISMLFFLQNLNLSVSLSLSIHLFYKCTHTLSHT